jgi:hypothetical protein
VFHVELKQYPNSVRRFNLTREQLDARFLIPWLAGEMIELDERRYLPATAKLRIIEGPEVRMMGLGRGWAEAERAGEDITERLLADVRTVAAPRLQQTVVEEFKAAVVAAGAERRVPLREVAAMAGARHAGARVSEQLALAERAVWELLHHGRIELYADGEVVARERWQPIVLDWASWSADGAAGPVIESVPAEGLHEPS